MDYKDDLYCLHLLIERLKLIIPHTQSKILWVDWIEKELKFVDKMLSWYHEKILTYANYDNQQHLVLLENKLLILLTQYITSIEQEKNPLPHKEIFINMAKKYNQTISNIPVNYASDKEEYVSEEEIRLLAQPLELIK